MAMLDPISSASRSQIRADHPGSGVERGSIETDVGGRGADADRRVTPPLHGLDGLRGLAVAVVVAYHLWPATLPGGFVSVSLFFALSGFLITWSLLTRLEMAGGDRRGEVVGFYLRRARRLVPMSLATLLAVGVLWGVTGWAEADLGRDLVAGLVQMANWNAIVEGSQYRVEGENSPLMHLWSLSIEEQLYLVMPLVVLGLMRARRVLLVALVALGIAAGATAWHRGDLLATYFATHVRMGEVACGMALAAALFARRRVSPDPPRARGIVTVLGLASLAILGIATVTVSLGDPLMTSGGLLVAGMLSSVVVGASVTREGLGRAFDRAPLAWLGRRSYAIYLVHWPLALGLGRIAPEGLAAGGTILGSVGLAAITMRWFEAPIRRGAAGRWPIRLAAPVTASVLALAVLVEVSVPEPLDLDAARRRLAALELDVTSDVVSPTAHDPGADPSGTVTGSPGGTSTDPGSDPRVDIGERAEPFDAELAIPERSDGASTEDVDSSPSVTPAVPVEEPPRLEGPPARSGPVRFGVVGDSTGLAYALGSADADHPDTRLVESVTELGCPLGRGGRLVDRALSPVPITVPDRCRWDLRLDEPLDAAQRVEVMLVMFGTWDVRPRSVEDLGEDFVSLEEPAALAWLLREADTLTDMLLAGWAQRVVWTTLPEVAGDIDPAAVAAYNAIVAAQARHPSGCVSSLDLAGFVDGSGERDRLLPDDVHMSWEPEGGTAAEIERRLVAPALIGLVTSPPAPAVRWTAGSPTAACGAR